MVTKRTDKKLEKIINNLFSDYFTCVQVDIMSLGKITDGLKTIYLADDNEENKKAQYELLVEKYRVVTNTRKI